MESRRNPLPAVRARGRGRAALGMAPVGRGALALPPIAPPTPELSAVWAPPLVGLGRGTDLGNFAFPPQPYRTEQQTAGPSGNGASRAPVSPRSRDTVLREEWDEVDLLAGVRTPPLPSVEESDEGAVQGAEAASGGASSVEESTLTATSWMSCSWTSSDSEAGPPRASRAPYRAPFTCCDKSFATEDELLRHEGRMANHYRAKCIHKECGQWFNCGVALRNHQWEMKHKGVAFHHEGRLVLGEIPGLPLAGLGWQ